MENRKRSSQSRLQHLSRGEWAARSTESLFDLRLCACFPWSTAATRRKKLSLVRSVSADREQPLLARGRRSGWHSDLERAGQYPTGYVTAESGAAFNDDSRSERRCSIADPCYSLRRNQGARLCCHAGTTTDSVPTGRARSRKSACRSRGLVSSYAA